MKTTQIIKKLTEAKDCESHMLLSAFSSPLLNINNVHRVALFKDGKECGTTMSMLLFQGLKAKYLSDIDMVAESEETGAELQKALRNLLSSVHNLAQRSGQKENVMIAKTFQEKVFRHVIWSEPMTVSDESDLLMNEKKNSAHTVSDNLSPSSTIPSYLCRWVLEKDGLNPASPFKNINSYVKRVGREVFEELRNYEESAWRPRASFSRRLQNVLMMKAFETALPRCALEIQLKNPVT
jgi:hypothetical protein